MILALSSLPVSAGAADAAPWRPDVRAAREYAESRAGQISFGVRTDRRLRGMHVRRTVPSASVLKAMLLVAYLRQPGVRERPLRQAERALLEPMIRWSDNASASRVADVVGAAGVARLVRRAGMRQFSYTRPWGLSRINVADQTRLFLRIDRLAPRRHRAYARRLLRTIVPAQRWGIGRERPRGWALYFKGGWGSGTGWVDHQVALLKRGRRRLSVAILTSSSPSHAYGNETLRGIARRLLRGLRPGSAPR